jgi:lipopolysaccharide export LptBFGC system permease protein LptF
LTRTLYSYIGRDLAKVTGLALLAFTLIMTVFAIIEPMRRGGLAVDRTLWLVALTLPTMMSLTLPIAALFGATIVYGRFSQDNEMTACRASGISAISILAPALVLGGAVTVVSLALSSFVTPQMVQAAQSAVQSNVKATAYNLLRSESGVTWVRDSIVIHADAVNDEHDFIEGLVIASPDMSSPGGGTDLIVAPKAVLKFYEKDGDNWINLDFPTAALATTREGQMANSVGESHFHNQDMRLPSFVKENPSWYDWPKMIRILRDPAESEEVRDAFEDVTGTIANAMLAREIVSTIDAGRAYCELADLDGKNAYQISAASAKADGEKVVLAGEDASGRKAPVQVVLIRNGSPYQVVSAPSGTVEAKASEISRVLGGTAASFVTVELTGGVDVHTLGAGGDVQQREKWSMGQIPLPKTLTAETASLSVDRLDGIAPDIRNDPNVRRRLAWLGMLMDRWTRKVLAEMHVRLAYSLSCLLMVAMGAALGLMLRGGQVISAFAISVIPAAVVITMMVAGKEMAKNPDVPVLTGLLVIWVGVTALLAADAGIYYVLSRR